MTEERRRQPYKVLCGSFNIRSIKDRADDRNTIRARRDNLCSIFRVDASDRDDRDRDLASYRAQHLEVLHGPGILRRGAENRPEADIVRSCRGCGPRLFQAVRRNADDPLRTDDLASNLDRKIVLSEMDAMRIRCPRDVGMIVHDEHSSGAPRDPCKAERRLTNRSSAAPLVPVLKEPDARLKGLLENVGSVARDVLRIKDKVDAPDVTLTDYSTAP